MAAHAICPGAFIDSNSGLFVGQALANIYLTNFFIPAGVYFCLRAEALWFGMIGYMIEMSWGPGGFQNAFWWPAPLWLQAQMQVHLIQPIVSRISMLENVDLIFCLGSSSRSSIGFHPAPWMGMAIHVCSSIAYGFHHTPPISPPFNIFHYHLHHRRPLGHHVGMLPLNVGPNGVWGTTNRPIHYGPHLQFFRQA